MKTVFNAPLRLVGGRRDGYAGMFIGLAHEERVGSIGLDMPYIEFSDDDDETYEYILTDPDLLEFELVKEPDMSVPAIVVSEPVQPYELVHA